MSCVAPSISNVDEFAGDMKNVKTSPVLQSSVDRSRGWGGAGEEGLKEAMRRAE